METTAISSEFPSIERSGPDAPATLRSPAMASTERYRIGESIGRGGMGDVLAARDLLIGRDVAIKRLRRDEVPPAMLERFLREACIQGRLEHPAIVPVHELGIDAEGKPFFVMKKLSGTTLSRIVEAPDPVRHSRQRLLRAFVEICLAVEFAHTRGFLHRDLKPDNIVLGEFGDAYVIDWGIAKILGRSESEGNDTPVDVPAVTRAGATVGTPGYMAPEQASGERDLDARCDVYTLGCVLFEILAGERLHPLGHAGLESALRGIDARPSRRSPTRDIAPELDAICVRATARERDERYPSARALAEAVEHFLDGDRDMELRKKLAREQLDLASAAFAGSDPRTAMRHAGRALALDPTLVPAAELVGRLMLEPPREIPSEVRHSIERDHFEATRRIARVGLYAHSGYVIVLAMIGAMGFSAPAYPIAFALLIAFNVGILHWYASARTPRSPLLPLVGTTALLALLSRMFSPFLVGPAVASVSAMAYMLGVMRATWQNAVTLIAVTSMAVLGPWVVEELGYLSPSYESTLTSLIFYSPGVTQTEESPAVVFVIYTLVLVAVAVLMALAARRADGRVRERLHLQAWQLRQLVPVRTAD